jgi:hypothetical protein
MTTAAEQIYLPKTRAEREVLDRILACHRSHGAIIADRKQKSAGRSQPVWLDTVLRLFSHRALRAWVLLHDLGYPAEDTDLDCYAIPAETFEAARTPPKYRIRPYNLLREQLRLATHCPEVFAVGGLSILDLSAGSCAVHEIMPRVGHRATCADCLDPKSGVGVYRPIWDHYGISPQPFDGRDLPAPFEPESHDLVMCHQAIHFYGAPETYPSLIGRICALARKIVIVTFNAPPDPETGERWIDLSRIESPAGWRRRDGQCPETGLPAMVLRHD